MTVATEPVGVLVRRWRQRRRRSQLDLSIAAELSTRHLSFIETGRATPSPQMIERLSEELGVPLRERNRIHLAAGFAPPHRQTEYADLGAARAAVEAVLTGMEPNPAMAVNVRWELQAANRSAAAFLAGITEELTRPPANILRATLHPDGLAPRIRNLGPWRAHVLHRVRRQLDRTAAEGLPELLAELESYPAGSVDQQRADHGSSSAPAELVMPMQLTTEYGELSLLYTATVFGSPRDVTLDEIAIETFLPADDATAAVLRTASSS